tara:strand:- start:89 stop:682 length:594 start_codon:yes stop_codon:yes gene_type:complete
MRSRRPIPHFNANFFYKFEAVNAEQFIKEVEACSSQWINNSGFTWGTHSDSDKVPLKLRDFEYLMKPNIDMLIDEIGSDITPKYSDPWINMYTRGQYQEIHDHYGVDFASVFFANDGEGFAKFYFHDRHSIDLSPRIKKLLNPTDRHVINIKAGDIIFFPSHILHGVSPHKSDVVRKTFAVNFDLCYNETTVSESKG